MSGKSCHGPLNEEEDQPQRREQPEKAQKTILAAQHRRPNRRGGEHPNASFGQIAVEAPIGDDRGAGGIAVVVARQVQIGTSSVDEE